MTYDSRVDTYEHIAEVRVRLLDMAHWLMVRAHNHDESKLSSPEREMFDEFTPKLRKTTFGSPEYKANTDAMGEALEHHYEHNRHHPQHFGADGIRGMNLLDLLEMLCDWKAASLRHDDGDMMVSIEKQQERFGYSDELKHIFRNTALLLR